MPERDLTREDDLDPTGTGQGYAWEASYKRSWDILQEDAHGSLASTISTLQQQLLKKKRYRTLFLNPKESQRTQLKYKEASFVMYT